MKDLEELIRRQVIEENAYNKFILPKSGKFSEDLLIDHINQMSNLELIERLSWAMDELLKEKTK